MINGNVEEALDLVGVKIHGEDSVGSAFDLSLGATYRYHGKKMSYASASCPAPKGFTAAVFPFAKASYEFAGGPTLSAQLVRECRVKR